MHCIISHAAILLMNWSAAVSFPPAAARPHFTARSAHSHAGADGSDTAALRKMKTAVWLERTLVKNSPNCFTLSASPENEIPPGNPNPAARSGKLTDG
jgi:hypothetical protein